MHLGGTYAATHDAARGVGRADIDRRQAEPWLCPYLIHGMEKRLVPWYLREYPSTGNRDGLAIGCGWLMPSSAS